ARVERQGQHRNPGRLDDADGVAAARDDAVALGGSEAAKVGHGLPGDQRVDQRRAGEVDGAETIEIGPAFDEVLLEAPPDPMRALDLLNEAEGTAAHDIARREGRIR